MMTYFVGGQVVETSVQDGIEWVSVLFHGQSFMLHQVSALNLSLNDDDVNL